MIGKTSTVGQLRVGDYVLEGSDVPRWRKVERIEQIEREGRKQLRVWMDDGPGYYDLDEGETVVTGVFT